MKKLLISLGLLLGVISTLPLNLLESRALLTPPVDYDYSYAFNSGTPWLIKDSSGVPDSFVPTAVRYFDSGFYTYTLDLNREYSGGGTSIVGITQWSLNTMIQFTRSSSTWSDWSGSGDYAPTSSTIYTTTTSVLEKLIFLFNNTSDNAYYVYIDTDTNTGTRVFRVEYDGVNLFPAGVSFSNFLMNQVYIPPKTEVRVVMNATSSSSYLDGLYLKDLGLPNEEVILDAQEDGYSDGYSDGEDYGYDVGFEDGYNDGFIDGGGNSGVPQVVGLFRGLFSSVGAIFSIQILPSITIGTLILFPLLGIVFLFFKKVIQ